MQIAVSLTLLTLLPAMVMCVTPFLRITIVLHFLRQALGTQTTPSNQVLIGLALFLTIAITQPVAMDIYNNAWKPLERGEIPRKARSSEGRADEDIPGSRFVREKDVRLFVEISKSPAPRVPVDLGLTVLVPAYILSELKTGFPDWSCVVPPFPHH